VRGDNLKAKLSDINAIYPRYDNFTNAFLFVFRRPCPVKYEVHLTGVNGKQKNF